MKNRLILAGLLILGASTVRADLLHSPRFKSPSGKYEIIFVSTGAASVPFSRTVSHVPPGQKPQYVLLFYASGSSDPVSADWYTDSDPAPPAEQIAQSLLWSPQEAYVVVTHGQNAKQAGVSRWVISLRTPYAYGIEGDQLRWIDSSRLIANLKTKKVPGGVELVDAKKQHAELVVSPHAGIGYEIAAVMDLRVTVKEYLNHWGEEREKSSWDYFEPACFDLDLVTLKKRLVACPK